MEELRSTMMVYSRVRSTEEIALKNMVFSNPRLVPIAVSRDIYRRTIKFNYVNSHKRTALFPVSIFEKLK